MAAKKSEPVTELKDLPTRLQPAQRPVEYVKTEGVKVAERAANAIVPPRAGPGFYCPYCGRFHEDKSPDLPGGTIRCPSCDNEYRWDRVWPGKRKYRLTMVTELEQ